MSYFAPLSNPHGFPPAPLDVRCTQDLIMALSLEQKGGFGFEVADHLGGHLAQRPLDIGLFDAAMLAQLSGGSPQASLVAAFALATWPGEKPEGVQDRLLAELKARSPHSYRAAVALGKLGETAAGAVPDLLAYAQKTADWSEGYRLSALEAACRIQPELRAQFPEIDARLRQEEAALGQPPVARSLTPGGAAAALTDPNHGEALRASFLGGLVEAARHSQHSGVNLEQMREQMLAYLGQVLAEATDNGPLLKR